MQIRYATDLSAEQYVQQQGWKAATLNHCPLHPQGGCGFCKNGSYTRKFPDGAKIARWYCADGHMSFSLLPDCLASRLSGSLIEIEDVLTEVENSPSQEAAADNIRIDIHASRCLALDPAPDISGQSLIEHADRTASWAFRRLPSQHFVLPIGSQC